MNLGMMETKTLHDKKKGEDGNFSLEVTCPREDFNSANDKRGYVNHIIAKHLASFLIHHGVPEEYIYFFASQAIRVGLNYPAVINFGGRK